MDNPEKLAIRRRRKKTTQYVLDTQTINHS